MLENQLAKLFTAGHVPLTAGIVATGRNEPPALVGEFQSRDRTAVPHQPRTSRPLFACASPQATAATFVAGGQQVSPRREANGRHGIFVSGKLCQQFTSFHIPNLCVIANARRGDQTIIVGNIQRGRTTGTRE